MGGVMFYQEPTFVAVLGLANTVHPAAEELQRCLSGHQPWPEPLQENSQIVTTAPEKTCVQEMVFSNGHVQVDMRSRALGQNNQMPGACEDCGAGRFCAACGASLCVMSAAQLLQCRGSAGCMTCGAGRFCTSCGTPVGDNRTWAGA